MAAKKDPYKRIQKRFVQARAGDVAYEDLTPEQREQYQNRFNMLAQSVQGRGKIVQRILGPEATQEQRQNLRQRIKQNLPRTETEPITLPEEETPAAFTAFAGRRGSPSIAARPSPTFAGRRGSPSIAARPTTEIKPKKQDSDRIGTGYFSIPKNPVQLLKEVGQEFKATGEYYARTYVNPALNVGISGLEKLSGGTYKIKRFAEPTKGEIATESILALGGGLAGPAARATSRALTGAAGALGRAAVSRGAVAAGTPLVGISQRAAALRAVQAASARQQLGERAVASAAGLMDDIVRTQAPAPSGVKRPSAPTRGVKPTTATAPKAAKPKAAPKQKATTAPKVTTKSLEEATEQYAPGFNKEVGAMEMQATTFEPIETTVKQPKAAKQPKTAKQPKAAKTPKPISVTPVKQSKITTKQIETATEQYAPGFNKEVGATEMRSTQYEAIELSTPASPVAEVKAPTFGPSQEQREKALKFAKETIEWVKKEKQKLDISSSPVAEVKTPQPAKAPRKTTQKKSQVAAPKTVEQASAASPQRKVTIVKSQSEILYEALQKAAEAERIAKKAAFPGFTPKKVTKLPTRESALDKLEERGTVLWRMGKQGTDKPLIQYGDIPVEPQSFLKPRELQKEIEEQLIVPNVKIKKGEAINPRYTRGSEKTVGSRGETIEIPEDLSKGKSRFEPTRMPRGTEVGLSSEQRRAKFYREMFPEARSNRQARKLYEQSMGRQDPITTIGEFGLTGSPLGGAAKTSPITGVEIKKPIAYEKVIKAGEVVYKPVKFKTEIVPGIETTSGAVPIEELPQRWNVNPATVEAGRKAAKAETLKSRAKQAQRLRERGIQGEAKGARLQETLDDIKKGKAFQRRFDDIIKKDKK